jgi:hypothetical protein
MLYCRKAFISFHEAADKYQNPLHGVIIRALITWEALFVSTEKGIKIKYNSSK